MTTGINNFGVNPTIATAQQGLDQALERLSSGQRINSAADDAAGLAISTGLRTDIQGFDQASRNTADGISLAQTADSALGSISDSLQRIRELGVQASNGILNDSDRRAINAEVQQLQEEITQVAERSNFNNTPLLSNNSAINLQVGPDAGDTLEIETQDFLQQLQDSGFNDIDLSTQTGAQASLETIDEVQESVDASRSDFGALINRLGSATEQLDNSRINSEAADSRIADADFAREVAEQTRNDILLNASIIAQTNQNQRGELVLQLLS